jgi:glycosyltransferase involved in cell wall biosynthesis
VTSYNKERLDDVKDLLESVSRQQTRDFELIYITERDPTLPNTIEKLASGFRLSLRIEQNNGTHGLAEARNLGLSLAAGEIVAFVDDDVVLSESWARCVISAFDSIQNAIGITGPAHPIWVGSPQKWFPLDFDWLIGSTRWFRTKNTVRISNCWGMNMAFRTRELLQIGGFSTTSTERSRYTREVGSLLCKEEQIGHGLMAEDVEIGLRLRSKGLGGFYYVPCMLVHNKVHHYRLSYRYIVQRSSWVGYSRRNFRRLSGYGSLNQRFEPILIVNILRSLLGTPDLWRLGLRQNLSRYSVTLMSLSSVVVGYLLGPVYD